MLLRTLVLIAVLFIGKCWSLSLLEYIFGPKLGSGFQEEIAKGFENSKAELLAKRHGYPLESHEIVTEDDYVLTAHRIPYGRKPSSAKKTHPPVIVLHGLLATSEVWFMRKPKSSLGFLLADTGYDVWLPNFRGNYYSRKHKTLNPNKDAAYWNFSIHEYGYYDLAAFINHILNVTKQEKVILIAHSMGSCAGLILCSTRPEYNKKIQLFVNLAPVVYVRNKKGILFSAGKFFTPYIAYFLLSENILEIFPRRQIVVKLGQFLCTDQSFIKNLCLSAVTSFAGKDPSFDVTMLSVLSHYYPSGTSLNVMLHYHQMFTTGKFQPFHIENYRNGHLYKNKAAPEYNLKNVSVPVVAYYGESDIFSTEKDVEMLISKLPIVVGVFKVPYYGFNHMDFILGTAVRNLLYNQMIKMIEKYV